MSEQQPSNRVVQLELVRWRSPRSGRFRKAVPGARAAVYEGGLRVLKQLKERAIQESPVGMHPFGVPSGYRRFKDRWTTQYSRTDQGGEGILQNESDHAAFVLFPTRAHGIRPRRAHALRFQGRSGDVVFARAVHHPGTRGNDVPGRVQAAMAGEIERELNKVTQQVVQHVVDVFE